MGLDAEVGQSHPTLPRGTDGAPDRLPLPSLIPCSDGVARLPAPATRRGTPARTCFPRDGHIDSGSGEAGRARVVFGSGGQPPRAALQRRGL